MSIQDWLHYATYPNCVICKEPLRESGEETELIFTEEQLDKLSIDGIFIKEEEVRQELEDEENEENTRK